MADHPDASIEEQLWSVAAARILLGPDVHVQAPPNLAYDDFFAPARRGDRRLGRRLARDRRPREPGGTLAACRAAGGGVLRAGSSRAAAAPLPGARRRPRPWADPAVAPAIRRARRTRPRPRGSLGPGEPVDVPFIVARDPAPVGLVGDELGETELVRLFSARGLERERVFASADRLRRETCGDAVTYVVTRNVQYTNVCYFRCGFCARRASSPRTLRGPAYLVSEEEIVRRVREAWERGATEVCLRRRHPSGVHG